MAAKVTPPKTRDATVERWFATSKHPQIEVMAKVRDVFLSDPRVTETIKWQSPTFMYQGNIASIDPHAKQNVVVLFHRGADIPGKHPILEGGGQVARYARFADAKDVSMKRTALRAVIRAWCESRAEG